MMDFETGRTQWLAMKNSERHDPEKDVGTTHAPPEGGKIGPYGLTAAAIAGHPLDGTDGGLTRRAPALTMEASRGRQGYWSATTGRDRAELPQAEPDGEVADYRARMLAKVRDDQSRAIAFTDAELADFISHAKGLGFGQADIEAILSVKVRKPGVECETLMDVAHCLAKKREDERIRFKEGWDFMRAYREAQDTMLKGNALEANAYLDAEYIESHRKAFSGKASYLIHGENHELYIVDKKGDYPELGYKGALYVSTAAEIDRVLKEANGDISVVEHLLGFSPGWLQRKKGIWRVDVNSPETKGLEIPNGFEASANEWWTPGAITSGGAMEAVLDQVPKSEANFSSRQVIF
jgi:hypothetical protein